MLPLPYLKSSENGLLSTLKPQEEHRVSLLNLEHVTLPRNENEKKKNSTSTNTRHQYVTYLHMIRRNELTMGHHFWCCYFIFCVTSYKICPMYCYGRIQLSEGTVHDRLHRPGFVLPMTSIYLIAVCLYSKQNCTLS